MKDKTVLLRDRKRRTACAPTWSCPKMQKKKLGGIRKPPPTHPISGKKIWKKNCQPPSKNYWKLFRKTNLKKKCWQKKFLKKKFGGDPPRKWHWNWHSKKTNWDPPNQISGTSGGKILNYRDPPTRSVGHLMEKFWNTGTPPQSDQWDIWWQNSELQGTPPPLPVDRHTK